MQKPSLSVSIISLNEEANLGRCLKSVMDIASEIVVVDCGSTDRTAEIAAQFGARFICEPWKGHVAQKNSALEKCTRDWILALDCDEELSPALQNAIRNVLSAPAHDGYAVNRKTFFLGKWINHAWYPDRKVRLVRRGTARWEGHDPHDKLTVSGSTERIDGDLNHYSYKDADDYFTRSVKYARISAQSYIAMNRDVTVWHILFNPSYSFIKHFFLKLGFLDGLHGLIIATGSFYQTFMKYLYLWEHKNSGKGDR